jgi:hypothetical protein
MAAGPFTFDTDLSFEPLQALLEVAEQERPDVLILVSFVPSKNAGLSDDKMTILLGARGE